MTKPKPTHPILSGRIPPVGSFVSKLKAYCEYCNQRVEVGAGLTYKVVGRFRDRWITQHALRCPPRSIARMNEYKPMDEPMDWPKSQRFNYHHWYDADYPHPPEGPFGEDW